MRECLAHRSRNENRIDKGSARREGRDADCLATSEGGGSRSIIPLFFGTDARTMDAEHINRISNHLDDLAARATELRRYL